MAQEFESASPDAFWTLHAHLIELLYADAGCARWGLSCKNFGRTLQRSVEKRFRGGPPSDADLEAYLKSLHLQDLALACACSEGLESAWEFFVAQFRQELRTAARSILRGSGANDEVRAEELADSLYAELYGVRTSGSGQRKSLLEYFHGRSKLSTWLRAVLAQRHVDMLRTSRRTVPLDDEEEGRTPRELAQPANPSPADPDRERLLARFDGALSDALAGRTPRERLLLAYYYIDQLTLAEIGRALGEHESTVSRQMDRTRRELREAVTESLLRGKPTQNGRGSEPGLDEAQVELAFACALEDWPFDLSRALSKEGGSADSPEK